VRSAILASLLLCVSGPGSLSCAASGNDEDLKPPPDFVPPPVVALRTNPVGPARLGFREGFYPPEFGDGRTWRWMGSRGEVRLSNDGSARRLRIAGWIPTELLKESPTIRISMGGRAIGSFVESKSEFEWRYVVPPDVLGMAPSVTLVIETSRTVQAPGDPRDLGISIERVDWVADQL
jgi:hypothetical protein